MAAGDFTLSELKKVLLREQEIWAAERSAIELRPDTDTINAIINNQTANFTSVEGTMTRDTDVEVTWLDSQAIDTTQAYTPNCNPTGTELESKSEGYTLDILREAEPFSVKTHVAYRDNEFDPDDVVVRGLIRQRKILDDYVNQQSITKLSGFSGVNLFPANVATGVDPTGTNNPTITYIEPAQWGENLFPHFMLSAQMNRFGNPWFIHGFNYNPTAMEYQLDRLNDNERDKAAKLGLFRHIFDPISFSALGQISKTYMIDANALAFAHKYYHPTDGVMQLEANKQGFALASLTIPGLYYDVIRSRTCDSSVVGEPEEFVDTYQMRVKAGLFLNPVHVAGNTGVLEIEKGTRPTV